MRTVILVVIAVLAVVVGMMLLVYGTADVGAPTPPAAIVVG